MKKILVPILLLCLFSGSIYSQTSSTTTLSGFQKGDNVLGLGFGIGGAYGINNFSTQTPAFGIHFEHAILNDVGGGVIGIGGYIGYKAYVHKVDIYKEHWNYVMFGVRGAFHYNVFEVQNLDTYAGMMLAYYSLHYENDFPAFYTYRANYSGAAYASIYAGARYYFTPQVGAFAEVGYGVSWLTIGGSLKF